MLIRYWSLVYVASAATCATREREASDASRALVDAQGDLAKATLRMRTDEQEVSRCKHDMDLLNQKLQHRYGSA